ncbi:hypothetical protein FOCC_FOCC012368 [Frankliniella occidentalis]|nr:hypothetical protein FOCC_FOCC012368 [Frankliniella occidentalis]
MNHLLQPGKRFVPDSSRSQQSLYPNLIRHKTWNCISGKRCSSLLRPQPEDFRFGKT